ncbi:MAG TPA: winged helix-turn-helix domain-containing protein [Terracidiphilus sp.]|nr:winged helix-turn-helix domain-containing protein [Terracidiphilus sp.]
MNHSSPTLAETQSARYVFSGFRLEPDGRLLRGESTVLLSTEETAVLRLLLARAGETVSPLELKRAAWGDKRVSSDVVAKCIASLCGKLQPADCIECVYKRGYRFVTAVHRRDAEVDSALPRLAVLPFTVGYGVANYLGSAIAEETATALCGGELAVAKAVARDSIAALARRGTAPLEIGRMLNADLVLCGTLNATPERLRLRAAMTRVADGCELWIDDLMVERKQIAQLEWELVHRVSSRMNREGLSIAAVAARDVEDGGSPFRGEAHELYLRAHHEWQMHERHHMQDAVGLLQRAIELDSSLVAARTDLAHLCVAQAIYGFMPASVSASMVRRAAQISPASEDLLWVPLAWIRFHVDRDLGAALDAFARSAHLPHDEWVTRLRLKFLLSRRQFEPALDELRAAIQIDPYSPWLQAELAWALHLAGQAEESVDQVRRAISQFTECAMAHLYGAMILGWNGEAARAVELARALASRLAHFDAAMSVHAYALACAGRKEEARTLLERLQWLGRERFVMNSFDAATYVAMEEDEAALDVLRIANERRCPWFFQLLADPRLQPLSGRPEFERMRGILRTMETGAETARDNGEETDWIAARAG